MEVIRSVSPDGSSVAPLWTPFPRVCIVCGPLRPAGKGCLHGESIASYTKNV